MANNKIEKQREFEEQHALLKQALVQLNGLAQSQNLPRPKCFISFALGDQYEAWKDKSVGPWVDRLEEDLRLAGLDTVRDRPTDTPNNTDVVCFANRVAACDRILVVATPTYLKIYQNRLSLSGSSIVAAEMEVIEQRLKGTTEQQASIVPLMLSGNERFSLPESLRSRKYADFRVELDYFITAFDLVLDLYGISHEHPSVSAWRRSLRPRQFAEGEADSPEFTPEQMKEALVQLGEEIRKETFAAGRPIIVLKHDRPVWIYPDGREEPVNT